MHPLSALDLVNRGPGTTPRDRNTWVITTLKVMEHFTTIPLPNVAEGNIVDMDTMEGLPTPARPTHVATDNNQGRTASNKGKAHASRVNTQPRQSDGDTSPERRAYNAPADPNRIKSRQYNMFQPLAEEHIQESTGNNDKVREGSISYANNSRGARIRDPINPTPAIFAMLDRHEPDKSKQAKLLTEHLAGQRVVPSTEEELQQHLERKAKRETDRLLASTEARAHKQDQASLAATAQKAMNAAIVQTFAKRARETALAAGATQEAAEATTTMH